MALAFLFVLATLVQFSFWGLLFSRLLRQGGKHPEHASLPPFSVVVCARNEADHLAARLPSVLEQAYPSFEVIVVDHASSDGTQTVLQELATQYPQLRVLHCPDPRPGKKRALALGIAAARYDWLALTDADCRPGSRQWLQTLARQVQDGVDVVLGYGPLEPGAGLHNAFARFETALTAMQYGSYARAGMPYMGVGRNLAFRRSALLAYDPASHADLASGDDDLAVNALARADNTRLAFDPAAFAWSAAPSGWNAFFRQKARHVTTSRRYRPLHQAVLVAWALSFLGHYGLGLLLLFGKAAPLVLAGYGLRMLLAGSVFAALGKRLAVADLRWKFPLLDAMLAVYYLLLAPAIWLAPRQKRT